MKKNKIFFLIKNCNLSKLQEKPSALRRELPALQNMKFLSVFLFLWVIFACLNPDPDSETLTGTAFKFSFLWKYFSQSHFLFLN